MAHDRKRHAQENLKRLLDFSPIVGVFGHRQVGKTTLLAGACSQYVTLDSPVQRSRLENDPEGFLAETPGHPLGIDEAQYVPALFPALKEYVRTQKKPGQFLLSGSVRFTSRKAIRESLTGRIVFLELLPFTQAEMDEKPLNRSIFHALNAQWNKLNFRGKPFDESHIARYLRTGGLPGVCFIRSEQLRVDRLESQLETILDRDLRLVWETRLPYATLRNVLTNLALSQGQPLELQALARRTRVSVPTLRHLLWAFESIFLIRILPTEGTEKKPVVFLEDQGEATYLIGRPMDKITDLTRFLFAQIRVPLRLGASQSRPLIFQYRTRGGAFVPLACRVGARELGIIPIAELNPGKQAVASATSFLRAYRDSRVIFVNPGSQFSVLARNLANVPISAFA